jgi:LPS export ABC transporter protein LptC
MSGRNLIVKCFLAGMLVSFAACENDPTEVVALTKETKEVEEGRGIKANFSQSGNMTAILEAPVMYRVKADTIYTEFPESVHVTFYNKEGTIDNQVEARYAKYFELLRKVYMSDSVVVFNTIGDTLYAEDLWWDQDQEIFYSTNPVRIRTISQKLRGTGITAKSDFSKYTIHNPVGDVAIPEEIKL